jgi:hypothetical protein
MGLFVIIESRYSQGNLFDMIQLCLQVRQLEALTLPAQLHPEPLVKSRVRQAHYTISWLSSEQIFKQIPGLCRKIWKKV